MAEVVEAGLHSSSLHRRCQGWLIRLGEGVAAAGRTNTKSVGGTGTPAALVKGHLVPRAGGQRDRAVAASRSARNAVAESFFATLKDELIYRQAWPTREAARAAIFEFIEIFYNRHRLHSALGYLSPADHETIHHSPAALAA